MCVWSLQTAQKERKPSTKSDELKQKLELGKFLVSKKLSLISKYLMAIRRANILVMWNDGTKQMQLQNLSLRFVKSNICDVNK